MQQKHQTNTTMIAEVYIHVPNDNLRDISEETKKIWDEAVKDDEIFESSSGNGYKILENVYFALKSECTDKIDDKDPYGIPNVNFTLINQTDNRWEEYKKQRIDRGFDDSELWSLDVTISKFILPRLKTFKDVAGGYPGGMTENEWDELLDKMIVAFELHAQCKVSYTEEENEKIKEGLKIFSEYFGHLWY